MAVSTTDTYSGPFVPNGITVAFPFSFKAMSAAEVRVDLIDADGVATTLPADAYTVTLNAEGGSVGIVPAPVGAALYIISDPSFLQNIAFATGQPYRPETVNEANDRAAARDLVLKSTVDRAAVIPVHGATDGYIPVVRDGAFALEPSVEVQMEVIDEAVGRADDATQLALLAAANLQAGEFIFVVEADTQSVFDLGVNPGVRPYIYIDGARQAADTFEWSGATVTLHGQAYKNQKVVAVVGEASLQPTVQLDKVYGLPAELDQITGSIDVARTAQPLNLLDALTPIQRVNLFAGSMGIDEALDLAFTLALPDGRPIDLPAGGNFQTSVNGVIDNPGLPVNGNGAMIRKVGTGPLFRTAPSDPALVGGELVAGTVQAGVETVTLQAGKAAAFSVGQWVVLMDRTRIFSLANNFRAEILRVRSIVGDVVSFWSPTRYPYLGGATAGGYGRIVGAPMIEGVAYSNLNIEMDPTIDIGSDAENKVFDNRWLLGARFENIRIANFVGIGIDFNSCLAWQADNVHFVVGGSATTGTGDPTSSEGLGGFSYGVCERGPCAGGRLSGATGINLRHVYSTVSLVTSGGVPVDYGEPRGTMVVNCLALFAKNAAFDTHEAGRDISFYSCKSIGGHYVGMQIRSRDTVVNGFEAVDHIGCAVWIRGGATTPGDNAYAADTIVDAIVAKRTNLGVSFDGTDWREFGAVMDEASRTRGGRLLASQCGGPALMMYRNGGNSGGVWERVVAVDCCQKAVVNRCVVFIPNTGNSTIAIEEVASISNSGNVVNIVKVTAPNGAVRIRFISASGHTGPATSFSGGAAEINSVGNFNGLRGELDALSARITALGG